MHDEDLSAEQEQREVMAEMHALLDELASSAKLNRSEAVSEEQTWEDQMLANLTKDISAKEEERKSTGSADIAALVQLVEEWSKEAFEKINSAKASLEGMDERLEAAVEQSKAHFTELR